MEQITYDFIKDRFGLYLLKVAEKEQYIDELLAGQVYMKASGYFRTLEDGFRGDINDGVRPVDVSTAYMKMKSPEGVWIDMVHSEGMELLKLTQGFVGDDRVPIFCATLFDDRIIQITGSDTFRIKNHLIEEMSQFGNYVAMISLYEMVKKINNYSRKYRISFAYGPVDYLDIMHAYQKKDFLDEKLGILSSFFKKDYSYQNQNEWRMLINSKYGQLDEGTDHTYVYLGKFEYGYKLNLSDFSVGEFQVGESGITFHRMLQY